MNEKKDLADMLMSALDMEEKGFAFYQAQEAKSKNSITKNMFLFLADNELYHIESIKKFSKNLEGDDSSLALRLSDAKESRIKELDIFSRNMDELNDKISPDDDDKKACEFAMEFEKNGYNHYKAMLKQASDPGVVKFLEFLLEEESRHYEIIEKMYNYLIDSANWFMYEEGSFPQG
jgi:rubrerythrin